MAGWITALLLLISGSSLADERFERIADVQAGGTLVVALERGTIEVDTHDAPQIRIEAVARGLGAEDVAFSFERRDGRWVLRGEGVEWLQWLSVPPRVRVRAWVPRGFAVELETLDGGVEAHHLEGGMRARTRLGSILVDDVRGPVDLASSGGAVVARFATAPRGQVYSEGGAIELSLPWGAGVDLDARSTGGRVVVDRELGLQRSILQLPLDDRAVGAVNGGGAMLHLRGAGGDIHLRTH